MDNPQLEVPPLPERDEHGGDDLPTYDDLASQHGPNSRFGRWRKWVEKRAAERYADVTPDELARRRAKGWGEGIHRRASTIPEQGQASASSRPVSQAPQLHVQTDFSLRGPSPGVTESPVLESAATAPVALIPDLLTPAHLGLYTFGSRFLPHTTAPIRCLLPILGDSLLLIGHDGGLSVLEMFPREWGEDGIMEKGPNEAEARAVWVGEAVFQLSILEQDSAGTGTPQGVLLALVGPEPDYTKDAKEQEGIRSLRMYNLASIISLAKWTVTQKNSKPLNLREAPVSKKYNTLTKKHRPQTSITKGLKSFISDGAIAQPQDPSSHKREPEASYSPVADSLTSISAQASINSRQRSATLNNSIDSEESLQGWDVVEDLPLRWATHYTPLASPGSRLVNNSVLFYEVNRQEGQRGRGGALLAVATKSNIFLYEAPKGERAFHLIKEFYTPLTATGITFVQQSVQDAMARSSSDVSPRALASQSQSHRRTRVTSFGGATQRFPQLSLFVIFEKRAGLIRIADSAVGEVELYEDGYSFLAPAVVTSPVARKGRASWDGRSFLKDNKGPWAAPVKLHIPGTASNPTSTHMYVVTRGKSSHVLPYPLPYKLSSVPPYRSLVWSSPPTQVSCRICSLTTDGDEAHQFLQAVAFGEDGIEVQELPLSSLSENKGKGRAEEPVRAQSDMGGATGFLQAGGQWHRSFYQILQRSDSTFSSDSESTLSPEELAEKMRAEQGVYGWVQKGLEDWRVFWVGGTGEEPALTDDVN